MIKRFNVTVEKNDDYTDRENIYGTDVLDMFNAIPWNEERKEYFKSEEEFGSCLSVRYKDSNNLEFSFEVELYFDDENKDETLPLKYSLSYSYQEIKMEKAFLGLFGEKEKIIDESIFMDDQDMDFTLKCLNAFIKHDHEFLKNNMYENFGPDLKE